VRRAVGLAAAAWLGLAACSRPEAVPPPKPLAVTVVRVAQRPVPVHGQYVGRTEAVKTVEIRARVEGYIERQVAPDGADVKSGDVLFVIDPRPFEIALRQAEANVARDVAQLGQAEAALVQRQADILQANLTRELAQAENARTQEGRYRTLLDRELIAREQYDQVRTSMAALDATVQADRAALGNTKAPLAAAAPRGERGRRNARGHRAGRAPGARLLRRGGAPRRVADARGANSSRRTPQESREPAESPRLVMNGPKGVHGMTKIAGAAHLPSSPVPATPA
jgi:multidrug efflux pump subunit AcrA (membrane-fusion protein)